MTKVRSVTSSFDHGVIGYGGVGNIAGVAVAVALVAPVRPFG